MLMTPDMFEQTDPKKLKEIKQYKKALATFARLRSQRKKKNKK